MKKSKKDIFAQVPELLAAFDNISRNGFFGGLTLNVMCPEGVVHGCEINATGYVPNNKKYKADGCGLVIDPNDIIASCRSLAAKRMVRDIRVQIETKDWPRHDREGERVVGSKGTCTEMRFLVFFK